MPWCVPSWFSVLVLGLQCLSPERVVDLTRESPGCLCARSSARSARHQIVNPLTLIDAVVRPSLVLVLLFATHFLSLRARRISRERAPGASVARSSARS